MFKTITINQSLIKPIVSQYGLKSRKRLSNHDMLLVALHPYNGTVLTVAEMKEIVKEKFPEFNLASMQPNDHSQKGNKSCCSCVGTQRQLLMQVEHGKYMVI